MVRRSSLLSFNAFFFCPSSILFSLFHSISFDFRCVVPWCATVRLCVCHTQLWEPFVRFTTFCRTRSTPYFFFLHHRLLPPVSIASRRQFVRLSFFTRFEIDPIVASIIWWWIFFLLCSIFLRCPLACPMCCLAVCLRACDRASVGLLLLWSRY